MERKTVDYANHHTDYTNNRGSPISSKVNKRHSMSKVAPNLNNNKRQLCHIHCVKVTLVTMVTFPGLVRMITTSAGAIALTPLPPETRLTMTTRPSPLRSRGAPRTTSEHQSERMREGRGGEGRGGGGVG